MHLMILDAEKESSKLVKKLLMKQCLAFLFCLVVCSASAQSADPQLVQRLDQYAKLNRELKFRELMDFIHPSLFTIAAREDVIEAFETGFENEGISMKIDSIAMVTIGTVFEPEGIEYHNVDYYMVMSMRFKDDSGLSDPVGREQMTANFRNTFSGKKVDLDLRNATFRISGMDV